MENIEARVMCQGVEEKKRGEKKKGVETYGYSLPIAKKEKKGG